MLKMFTEFPVMLKVFKNPEHQAAFERDGYLVLPFYNEEEVAEMKEAYHRLHPKDEKGFFPSTFSKDAHYRDEAHRIICEAGKRSMEKYFENYRVFCGSYIVKSPKSESYMVVHQDMTLVDESKFTAINIWAPLIDLNTENGALEVLKGGHRLIPTLRGATITAIYNNVEEEIKKYTIPYYLKAGEAIIFDQSIIHYSPPNMSDESRIVVNTFLSHEDAKIRVVYANEEEYGNKVEIFEQEDDFMTTSLHFGYDIFSRPKTGKSLGLVDYPFPNLTPEILADKYEQVPVAHHFVR